MEGACRTGRRIGGNGCKEEEGRGWVGLEEEEEGRRWIGIEEKEEGRERE